MKEWIFILLMGICLIVWVIFFSIKWISDSRKQFIESGQVYQLQCESCKQEFSLNAKEVNTWLTKSRSLTKTQVKDGALVNIPKYQSLSKKVLCPYCGKKRWAQILDVNEKQENFRPSLFESGIKCLIQMVIGGLVIMLLFSVPIGISSYQKKQELKKQKEEIREEFLQDLEKGE